MPKSEWDRLRFAVYDQNPNLFGAFQLTVNELHTIVYTFAEKRKYDLTRHGLQAIQNLLQRYMILRHGSLRIPSSAFALFQSSQITFDPLLTQQLEQFNSHGRRAQAASEQELVKQIIATLSNLAIFALNIESAFEIPGESPVANFISAYHWGLLRDAAVKRQDDVALEGGDQLLTLGRALIQRTYFLNAQTVAENLESLAMIAVLSSNDVVLGNAVRAMSSLILSNAIAPHPSRNLSSRLMEALERTTRRKLEQGIGLEYPQINFSLGPFLSVTNESSLARSVIVIANGIVTALREGNWDRAHSLISAYAEIHDHLWKPLADIGTDAAGKETFLLQLLCTSVHEMLKTHFWVWGFLESFDIQAVDLETGRLQYRLNDFKQELERFISWQTIGIFSRIVPVTMENKRKFLDEVLETLYDAVLMATETQMEEAIRIEEQITNICQRLLDKKFMYETPRNAVYVAKIGSYAISKNNSEVEATSVRSYAKLIRLWLAVFPEHSGFVGSFETTERELMEELSQRRLILHEGDQRWASSVRPMHIRAFFAKVDSDLTGEPQA